jgi:hypothetical protein
MHVGVGPRSVLVGEVVLSTNDDNRWKVFV